VPSYFKALQDLLFPPACLGCERRLDSSQPPLLCGDCLGALAEISSPVCPGCGLPFANGADHLCGDCLTGCYAFDLARALFVYQPPVSALILGLKFSTSLTGLATLGALAGRSECLRLFAEPEVIAPVPLHSGRLRTRGFNQSLLVARSCFPQWRTRITPSLLLRRRPTTPQAHLSGKERRTNLKDAFILSMPASVQGKRVLLIDDVFTTGSTVNECSKVLRAGGATRIEVFTLARSLSR